MNPYRWVGVLAVTGISGPAFCQYYSATSDPNYYFCALEEQRRKDEEVRKQKVADEEDAVQPVAGAATPIAPAPLARKPIDPNSPLGRGVRLHGEKEFQLALQQLLVAARSDPDDSRVHVYLADTWSWLGMNAESKQAAGRAKQLDPSAFENRR